MAAGQLAAGTGQAQRRAHGRQPAHQRAPDAVADGDLQGRQLGTAGHRHDRGHPAAWFRGLRPHPRRGAQQRGHPGRLQAVHRRAPLRIGLPGPGHADRDHRGQRQADPRR
ncbi:hypothetical protein G6F50_016550 [Rhizopus delemar]|uniref:Uncharacterized protein n=1 Tax=Rhizopus delemar TaxID=936053 RepID=A0A9P6XSS1_9FUNG|nr:hypothetical protein G6F50_016550 [Rhizopus delemar]